MDQRNQTTLRFQNVVNQILGSFTTAFIENDLEKFYFNSEYEETLAAWLATKLFIEENLMDDSINVDFEHSKEMNPWLLNKRINQF
jgi:hypothetical protein